MAVHVTLYENTSKRIEVSKTLTTLGVLEGTFRGEADILEPTILVKGEFSNRCNYFRIEEFGRFYYVTKPILMTNELIELHGQVDVLNSWALQIRKNGGIVERSEREYNLNLADPEIHAFQDSMIGVITFPTGLTHDSYILATVG